MITRQESVVNRLLTLTSVLLLGLSLAARAQILEAPNIKSNGLAMFIITNLLAEPQPELSVPLFSRTNTGPEGNYWRMQGTALPLPLDSFPELLVYQIGTNQYLIDDRSVDYPALTVLLEAEAEVEGWTNPPATITLMDTNGLWIDVPTNSLAVADYFSFNLMNTLQGQGYDILTTSNLLVSWATELTVTGAVGNVTPVQLPLNDRTNLFVEARPSVDYSFYLVTQPLSQEICDGDTVTFSVETGGNTNLSFQWTFNGVAIQGATNASYSIGGFLESEQGNYACVISDGTNSLATAPAQLKTDYLGNDFGLTYLLGDRQNYTFKSGMTYYIGWPIKLYGNTTIEAGAVLKFDWHYYASLQIMGTLVCKGEPYSPAMLTSVDDDSVGEELMDPNDVEYSFSYEDGPPQPYPTGVPYLEMAYATSNSISNLRISYADWGVTTPLLSRTLDVWDCQFVQCNFGVVNLVAGTGAADNLHNVLFSQCSAAVAASTNAIDIGAEQVTAQVNTFCLADLTPGTIALTNSIIWGNGLTASNLLTVNVVSNPDPTNFQATGAGSYYLAPTSLLHSAGTASISPRLQSELQSKTTYPPVVIPAFTTLSGAMTFSPQTPRYAGGAPDLGWYYDALDYTVDDLILNGGTLTVLPGTAIGYRFDTQAQGDGWNAIGIDVQADSSLLSQGTPNHPNYFVDVQQVQEQFTAPILAGIVPDYFPSGANSQPPVLSFRFCKFRLNYIPYYGSGPRPAFHFWSGVDPITFSGWSYNSAMYFTLQDCDLRGGQISLGQPEWDYVYGEGLFWGAGAVGWTNNSFDNVCINLDPSYFGYTNVDLAFSACNNLFRGGWFRLQSIPASGGSWSLNDNLFDQVEIAQNAARPLNFSNNGYWPLQPLSLWWDSGFYPGSLGYYSVNLEPTNSARYEVTLSGPPAYETGPFGNFYLPNTTALHGAGSRTPASVGLYHYTTRIDQGKEGSESAGHNVNIGMHYVAANTNGLPADSDGDGIPDYVENWNGDGNYSLHTDTETDWQNAYTASGIYDPTNSVYDDVDLSGNGLVGRIKKALGTSTFDPNSPLTLTQVLGGAEPGIVTFRIPISYALIDETSSNRLGKVSLLMDGAPLAVGCESDTNGWCLLHWQPTFSPPGFHILQAVFVLDYILASGPDPDLTVIQGPGRLVAYTADTGMQFDPFYSQYDNARGAILYAKTPTCPNATYSIELQTTNGAHIKTITGTTGNGEINEPWGLTDDQGHSITNDSVNAVFRVTLLDPGSYTNTLFLNRVVNQYLPVDGDFTIAYGADHVADEQDLHNCIQWTVVDQLLGPCNDTFCNAHPYNSSFNSWSALGTIQGNPGHLAHPSDCDALLANLANTNILQALTKNFYYFGHAGPSGLGTKDYDFFSTRDVASRLENQDFTYGHPGHTTPGKNRSGQAYRLVFLDGCATAYTPDWAHAFGVFDRITTQELANEPEQVQAFVGWDGLKKTPRAGSKFDMANCYTVFWSAWQSGLPLDRCIWFASQDHPPAPVNFMDLSNYNFGPRYQHWNAISRWQYGITADPRIKLYGYAGITRTGYAPGYDNSPYYR